MRINQEIKEITLNSSANIWEPQHYPDNGFYNVNNKQNLAIVHNNKTMVMYFPWGDIKDALESKDQEPETIEAVQTDSFLLKHSEGTVSESFALKAMSIVLNKERFSELNPE